MIAMRRAVWLLILLVARPALAQDGPVVRAEVSPREVSVGESVTLTVVALCPTWFAKPARFPSAELANTITRLPARGSRPTQERVGQELWSGVAYRYEIFPLLAATYRLHGESVGVTCAVPGTISGDTVEVPLEEVIFRATVPEGAESLNPYLAGRSLDLERRIEGDVGTLEAGDALVVSYTAELDGLPAMFLPPLVDPADGPGLSVYADQPEVEDGPPARRTERYTFVFEAGGTFTIPGAALDWWNREAERIETTAVETTAVSVVGDPPVTPEQETPPKEPIDWRRLGLLLVLVLIATPLLARVLRRLRDVWIAARERRLASEEHAFRELERALRGRDRQRANAALRRWVERLAPGLGLGEFVERYGDDSLRQELESMARRLYRDGDGSVRLNHLLVPLRRARRRARDERKGRRGVALPPLNP